MLTDLEPPSRARRAGVLLTVVAVAMAVGACTKGTASANGSAPTTSSAATISPSSTLVAKPGEYTYENAGITAQFKYVAGGGTLSVKNGSGNDVGSPGIYILDGRDGKRINGTVQDAADLPAGGGGTFRVTFPERLEPSNVGFVVLILGHANYGGFVPPA